MLQRVVVDRSGSSIVAALRDGRALYVSVRRHSGEPHYCIRCFLQGGSDDGDGRAAAHAAGRRLGAQAEQEPGQEEEQEEEEEEGRVVCDNCGRRVPVQNARMHEAFCRKHNECCPFPGCGRVLQRGADFDDHFHCPHDGCGLAMAVEQFPKHEMLHHQSRHCDDCDFVSNNLADMVKHTAESCPGRLVVCRFCDDTAAAGPPPEDWGDREHGLTGHESECGSRSAPCPVCRTYVRLKDQAMHMAAFH